MAISSAVQGVSTAKRQRFLRSTVVLHAAAAVTGLIMVLYLLAHMYGNYKVFSGQVAFDGYSHYLRTMGEPLLPRTGALWIIRVVLLASVLIHMYAIIALWRRMRKATAGKGGRRYQSRKNPRGVQRTYSSFTMRWGGIIIFLFVIYHILHLTVNAIAPGGASESPYERVVNGFSIWWVVATYVIAMLALGFHLRHGFWSALASLGANTSPARRRLFNQTATVLAVVITVGFLIPPVAILFRGVGS
ncbi:succinate dehydrogenase cytochrome b subunit [Arthrobacter sp. H20]|uniref:succinate dehydrogenase cytochrome b subunit n=1 Tax=Arthrobacter sp. H20 TaxID=1267981 RepID=UPI0004B4BEAA|nr:succinate dehydrogenase cytochrome b subunit [Arthrobacter sp. H20]